MPIVALSTPSIEWSDLERRKGSSSSSGGRGGGGKSSGGSKGNGGGRSGGKGTSGKLTWKGKKVKEEAATRKDATASSDGDPTVSVITGKNQVFPGRTVGGGMRRDVFGTRAYGSGYGTVEKGTSNHNFPYYFWPVSYCSPDTMAFYRAYYFCNDEYGFPKDNIRPGGAQKVLTITASDSTPSTKFRVVADSDTIKSLYDGNLVDCLPRKKKDKKKLLKSEDYEGVLEEKGDMPKPEQAIQYYRGSSVVLSLDGYNNSAAFTEDISVPDTPLPADLNTAFLECLNSTIGREVLLMVNDGAPAISPRMGPANLGLLAVAIWVLSRMV
ncbi:hypothetical protein DFP72DRAFT_1040578 [Ephemerocybe angulata]|uniref:Uncharacterized protein n=1 Tax=Ephemerocybe angulata TaxID=980116 RepID=A0A8H6MC79_9AGAR|nr:hypothetical protein DFP72DRAFT_1040578 [Tulosesus angulatus]